MVPENEEEGEEKLEIAFILFVVCQGREDLARLLIDQGAFVDHQNNQGETALFWASSNGLINLVELLLENGSNPNVTNIDGVSPLHIAAANGHLGVVAKLAESGAFVNAQDEEMDSVLHHAVREKQEEVVRMLVRQFKARLDVRNEDLESPLDLALCLESPNGEYSSIIKILSPYSTSNIGMEMEFQHKGSFSMFQVQATLIH